jgi:threonine dehydrogenase-like Zn-dependent dehydrogenase
MPRRLAITGSYNAEFLAYEDAPLQDDQVLVRTELASGKHGTITAMFDYRVFSGQRFDPDMRLFIDQGDNTRNYAAPDTPQNVGTTGVGVVVEVGARVTRFRPGDRVFGLMDVRETNICHQDFVWPLGAIDPYLALCIEPSYVAFHCVRESQVRYGESVVVVGLGALGLLAVIMARQSGAENVIAIDLLAARRRMAETYGADYTFDPRAGDAALEVHRALGGQGADIAIELSGAYPALQTAIRSVRVGGTVCSAGFYQGEAQGVWLGREWHHNRLTMIVPHGCGWGHPPRDYPRWDRKRAYDCLANMMRTGRLTAPGLVNMTLPFEDGVHVFQIIRDRPDEVIKYAISFTQNS